MSTPRPARNVVYLHSHDTGRYVAPYGHALNTPHYQRFAEQGTLFRHAFCANPTCSPSRACLLTGRYAHTNGMLGLAHRGAALAQPEHLLPAYLRDRGFRTVLAGLQHIARHDLPGGMATMGYTDDLPPRDPFHKNHGHERDERTAQRAADFLQQRQPTDPPFFLDAGFFTTHRTDARPNPDQPLGPTVAWHNGDQSPQGDPRYAPVPPTLPDNPQTRADFADFAVAAQRLDGYVGQVLRALDDAGLADDTLVILTTDHGIAFPRMKCRLTSHGTGVLLMMRGPSATHPQGFTGGRVFDALASHVDVFPTVCAALGLDTPDWLQGTSLTPLLNEAHDHGSVRDHVFSEVNYHAAREPMRSIRNHRYHYLRHLEPKPHTTRPNIDNSVSKTQLHDAGLFDEAVPAEQLFDLWADPQETCNRAADPACADVLADLKARLDQWMIDTDDPARHGPIRSPGMILNAPDHYSPADSNTLVEA